MNAFLLASIIYPFAGFFFNGLRLVAEKRIDPTPLDALIIVGSGFITCVLMFLAVKIKPIPVKRFVQKKI